MKRIQITLALVFAAFSAVAQVTLGFPGESAASVGIYVKDLSTGEVVAQNDAGKAMVPASVMKVVTAASAFTTLSEDFRFGTAVYVDGPVADGVLNGNLIIKGCMDPTVDSENFRDRTSLAVEILDVLDNMGIRRIKGRIKVNGSMKDPGCIPQWEIDDVGWSYGAGLYPFNFRDNTFNLWPATKKTEPPVPGLNVTVKTGSSDIVRGINSDNIIVYGTKPADRTWKVRTAMQNPAESYAAELRNRLIAAGIDVNGNDINGSAKKHIFTHYSPKIHDILKVMLVESHNLYAESMLRQLAPEGTRKQAIERELAIWSSRNIPVAYNKILDGSGLARADRVQPLFIAKVLEWMAASPHASQFVSFLPKVGIEGTVKSFLKDSPLKGALCLKTGSMNAVQCYAGYKLDEAGKPTHVVVILINSFYCDRSAVKKAAEDFLLKTFVNPNPEN